MYNNFSFVAQYFVENGKTSSAIKLIGELESLAKNLDDFYFLGLAYKNLGEYQKAIYYFQKCLTLSPSFEQVNQIYLNLGMSYADSMQTEKGLEYLNKCSQNFVDPNLLEFIERRHKEIQQIQTTGYWTDHSHHLHSNNLANFISGIFEKNVPVHDLGCGQGFYLNQLRSNGFKKLTGYEGCLPKSALFDNILEQDITKNFKCKNKGNVICLEVAEHIPANLTENLLTAIKNCCNNLVVMSWAVRGQMGIGHVNCKNNDEAVEIMKDAGFLFEAQLTQLGRSIITEECEWFKKSLLIFRKLD
jgi:tryptophanyl-tRNA synthetase